MNKDLFLYSLQLADNALIHGHRISEWCGHGPVLEQDIALTNTALDHIGQARNFYQHAADLYNQLPVTDKTAVFTAAIHTNGDKAVTEDDLAYLRDAWDYKNVLLVEQPNEDWAYTIARSFYYDSYAVPFYTALSKSKNEQLAAIAEKSLKEALYHRRWSSEWVIRLGDGTDESKAKMQDALQERWAYTGELFEATALEEKLQLNGIGVDLAAIKKEWLHHINEVCQEATLTMPDENMWMQKGGKVGNHSEHLGYILAEMQYLQRAYPGLEW